jgi:hypothetical protein
MVKPMQNRICRPNEMPSDFFFDYATKEHLLIICFQWKSHPDFAIGPRPILIHAMHQIGMIQ